DHAARRVAELAVRAGADAEVVAEAPVVLIVHAAATRPGIGRDLVLGVAGSSQAVLAGRLHCPGLVVIWQRWRTTRKHGVGFEGQLVVRDVLGRQRDGLPHVFERTLQGLRRQ